MTLERVRGSTSGGVCRSYSGRSQSTSVLSGRLYCQPVGQAWEDGWSFLAFSWSAMSDMKEMEELLGSFLYRDSE